MLLSFSIIAEVKTANWVRISGESAQVETLTGDDGVVITPDGANNIDILGSVVANATHAKALFTESPSANTMEIDLQVAAAIASPDITKVGLAAFNQDQFDVDTNGFVTLQGGGIAIDSINVDANTPPGTDPVVPDTNGLVTVTGGQVAAGTTTNVIQTNSLAANTYTIQVQRSQAVASSTIGDNGVSHFNSTQLACDANGFVSISPYVATKGDLLTYSTTPAILPVGTNGQVLTADSAQSSGLRWGTNTPSGSLIQQVYTSSGTAVTTTNVIPIDNTIPQIGEGLQVFSLAITPTNASNFLFIQICLTFLATENGGTAALFQDATADALTATLIYGDSGAGADQQVSSAIMNYRMVAGTTSSTTFTVRIGTGNAAAPAAINYNPVAAAQVYGGVCNSTVTIWEIAA